MKFFKNVEVANEFKVTKATVGHWIESTQKGVLKLQLVNVGTREYIIDNPSNRLMLQELSVERKKFKNKKQEKTVSPTKKFYELFSEDQIIDIIQNLEIAHEIPHKYSYFNSGAEYWDKYVNSVYELGEEITIKRTIKDLHFDAEYLFALIERYTNINLIDIGPGNALPVKDFIKSLIKRDKLRKYCAVDVSPQMLEILSKNVTKWFGRDFAYECIVKDINNDSIQDLLFRNTHLFSVNEVSTMNLVFFIGSTIENQQNYEAALNIIKNSLGKNDIFVLGQLLDTDKEKATLLFSGSDNKNPNSDIEQEKLVLNLLGIDDTMYDVERYYSYEQKARIMSAKLKFDITLKIQTANFSKTVHLSNKDSIIIFRHNHHTSIEVINTLTNMGFSLLHATMSENEEQGMFICKVKSVK